MENHPAEDSRRQHRLYQASFLFRDYGFELEEMPFTKEGNLPLAMDPKLAWAHSNLTHAPVELNRAERESLMRVPGIGPKGARAIMRARKGAVLREVIGWEKAGLPTPVIPSPARTLKMRSQIAFDQETHPQGLTVIQTPKL